MPVGHHGMSRRKNIIGLVKSLLASDSLGVISPGIQRGVYQQYPSIYFSTNLYFSVSNFISQSPTLFSGISCKIYDNENLAV